MSGGSLNYASWKINEIIEALEAQELQDSTKFGKFVEHLRLVSEAIHDIGVGFVWRLRRRWRRRGIKKDRLFMILL